MTVYEYFKKKLFLHKRSKAIELTELDLIDLFEEEVSNEISVDLNEVEREDN